MQKKRNIRQLIVLASLTAANLLVFWWIQPENRLVTDPEIFLVDDLAVISRVQLAAGDDSVTVAFDGSRWMVNDTWKADAGMIRVLFATLEQARPRRPVKGARRDSIYRALEKDGVSVTLYEGSSERMRFLAGGNKARTQTFFADPKTGEVYLMMIPGYRVYVAGILEPGAHEWRDKLVFDFNWRNFKGLRAEFPGTPANNFEVSLANGVVRMQGAAQPDTARLNTFLDQVSLLTADRYLPDTALTDSLAAQRPDLVLTISDVGNRAKELRLFLPRGAPAMALLDGNQVVLIDRTKIQPIYRPRSFFIKK